jgi:hypothetical protein
MSGHCVRMVDLCLGDTAVTTAQLACRIGDIEHVPVMVETACRLQVVA